MFTKEFFQSRFSSMRLSYARATKCGSPTVIVATDHEHYLVSKIVEVTDDCVVLACYTDPQSPLGGAPDWLRGSNPVQIDHIIVPLASIRSVRLTSATPPDNRQVGFQGESIE